MKLKASLFLASFIASQLPAQTILSSGHADIGIGYESGWDLHVHDEETDTEYEPDEVILHANELTSLTVPNNTSYSFLGNPGDPIWILPQNQIVGALFLGIAAEEVETGLFTDDQITLSLEAFSGGGDFFLYQTDEFGDPTVFFDSSDGFTSSDNLVLNVGSHAHYNFAFTSTGIKTVGLRASGTLVDGDLFTQSDITDYTFGVIAIPEPGYVSAGLLVFALAVWLRIRRRA